MKIKVQYFLFLTCVLLQIPRANSQVNNPVLSLFPKETVFYGNIPYNNDTLKKHLLDIYMPPNAKGNTPLVVFIHGGGWLVNDKYADIGYMKNTVSEIIKSGFALASIDYRFATQATFPALIQDCNRAVSFLFDNADKYGFDKNRFALMGFSAGGHLASLQGLSHNNKVADFFMPNTSKEFSFKGVVDFYGPSDLLSLKSSEDPKAPEAILLGATPIARPDLAQKASPVSYIDKNDPPFLIIHGEKDDLVWNRQSKLLSGWLTVKGVENELIIVPNAPHFGDMFDVEEIRTKVIGFLKKHLK
jgi:acetyl esterase/lipase